MEIMQTPKKDEYYTDQEALIGRLTQLAGMGGCVFRGYNRQDQLLPSIVRDKDFSNVEAELLETFEKYGSHYFVASTSIDFLSYAQHYGIPTRLLDFTYNPFIALSFALFSAKSNGIYKEPEDKEYYYIRFYHLDDNILLKGLPAHRTFSFGSFELESIAVRSIKALQEYSLRLSSNDLRSLRDYLDCLLQCEYRAAGQRQDIAREELEGKVRARRLCFIDPNQSNQRIIMQQGLFLMPYVLSVPEHLELLRKNATVIKIHKDLRESLLEYLDTLGYNTFRLMPDLASVCAAVTQRVKEARTGRSGLFKKGG